MESTKFTANLRRYYASQFESIEEARKVLPEEVLIRWINIAWRNYQAIALVESERKARKEKK